MGALTHIAACCATRPSRDCCSASSSRPSATGCISSRCWSSSGTPNRRPGRARHRRRRAHPALRPAVGPGRHRRRPLSTGAWCCSSRTSSAALLMLVIAGRRACLRLPIDPGGRPGDPGDLFLGLLLAGHRRVPAERWSRRVGARTGQQRLVEPGQPRVLHRPGVRGASCWASAQLPVAFLLNAVTFAVVAVVLWRLPSGPTDATGGRDRAAVEHATEQSGQAPPSRHARRCGRAASAARASTAQHRRRLRVRRARRADRHPRRRVYNVGEAGTGLLNSAIGVGGVVGALRRRRAGPAPPPGAAAAHRCGRAGRRPGRCWAHAASSSPWRWSRWRRVGRCAACSRSSARRCSSASCPTRSAAARSASWTRRSVLAYAAGCVRAARRSAANDPLLGAGRVRAWPCRRRHHRRRPARPLAVQEPDRPTRARRLADVDAVRRPAARRASRRPCARDRSRRDGRRGDHSPGRRGGPLLCHRRTAAWR